MINVHGLLGSSSPPSADDRESEDQLVYVLELTRALGVKKNVSRVELATRRIFAGSLDGYNDSLEHIGESASIVRCVFGPDGLMSKERLWPHLEEFVDRLLRRFESEGTPDIIHAHHANAGWVATHLARHLNIPFVFTAHNFGLYKRETLLASGLSEDDVNDMYRLSEQIAAEELVAAEAAATVVNSAYERDERWRAYERADTSRTVVIPPGADSRFSRPFAGEKSADILPPAIFELLGEQLENPDKPVILAVGPLCKDRNFTTLMDVYLSSTGLRQKANLVLWAGNTQERNDFDFDMTTVDQQIEKRLQSPEAAGRVARIDRLDNLTQLAALFRSAFISRGVYTNISVVEPFGIDIVRALSCGLPVLATNSGGTAEILDSGGGLTVFPDDPASLENALLKLLGDEWGDFSDSGTQLCDERYNFTKAADAHIELYEGLLSGGQV